MVVIKSNKKRLIVCLIGMLLVCCFHVFISEGKVFVDISKGYLVIQDYAYHIILVKAFWFDGFGNIYDLCFQQRALSAYLGSQIKTVMVIGITPISLVLWLPFAYVARFSMAVSYTLWTVFSVGVLFAALWSVCQNVLQRKNRPILPITLCLVTIFSAPAYTAIYLGQTSILATGLLVYLIHIVHKSDNELRTVDGLLVTILIFALGMKPPYIALGFGLLIIYGMWRETLHSVAIVSVFLIGITPLLTWEWVPSYLHLLQMYSPGKMPDVYAWALVFEDMNIFRSAFRGFIGDNVAYLISNLVIYGVYLGIVGGSVLYTIKGKSADQLSPLSGREDQLFVLLVASYLLFAPYAGSYEDVLFLSVFVMLLHVDDTLPLTSYKRAPLPFFLFVILFHRDIPPDTPFWLYWILKAAILGYMLKLCRFAPETCPNQQ